MANEIIKQIKLGNSTYDINEAAGTNLGLVKTGGDVTISDGVITVNDDSHNHTIEYINGLQDALNGKIPTSQKGAASGVATLGSNGKVPSSQLPVAGDSLGGVKSGRDVYVSPDGYISVKSNVPTACKILDTNFNLTEETPSNSYKVNTPWDTIEANEITITAELVYSEYDGVWYDNYGTFTPADIYSEYDAINDIEKSYFILHNTFNEYIYDVKIEEVKCQEIDKYGNRRDLIDEYLNDGWVEGSSFQINSNGIYKNGLDLFIPVKETNNQFTDWSVYIEVWYTFKMKQTKVLNDIEMYNAIHYGLNNDQMVLSINQSYVNNLCSSLGEFLALVGRVIVEQDIGSDLRTDETTPYFNSIAFTNISPVYGDTINPSENGTYNLGSPDKKWKNIYVENIIGAGAGGKAVNYELKKENATIKLVDSDGTTTSSVPDSDTTYTFATGDNNGQIKVTPKGGTAQNVNVKGLGSAAYTESTAYLASSTKYAGSSSAGGAANSALKLSNTSAIGGPIQPVYFKADGTPATINYTIAKSVPSNAVFTDTTYSVATATSAGLMPQLSDNENQFLNGKGVWVTVYNAEEATF